MDWPSPLRYLWLSHNSQGTASAVFKGMKHSSCVESPEFSLGSAEAPWAQVKLHLGHRAGQKPKSKLHLFHDKPPVPDMTLPWGHLHTTARFCLRGKIQTSLETTFSEMLQIWFSSPRVCFHYHLQEESFEHQVFYQFQSLLSAEPIQAACLPLMGLEQFVSMKMQEKICLLSIAEDRAKSGWLNE